MEISCCPKCNEPMDEGRLLPMNGSPALSYVSQKQKGMFIMSTSIDRVHACPNCGYVELYLDPKELKRRLT